MVGKFFSLLLVLCWFPFYSQAVDCTTDTVGLCTPTIEQIIEESSIETIEFESNGYTVTTETTTTTTTTTVTNEDSGDLLDGDNDYVVASKEGDMDIDWGGQGPATMPSGNTCGQLGTDKCAMITGSGNSTSNMGVNGMGTTFINTIDISDLSFDKGGKTNYTIKVEKQDAQDSIYMHITGRNGKTDIFSGTDILSASGVDSGFKTYEGGFNFGGSLTTIIVEVGGRDINLAVGPMFDDVTINVLYNVVSTIVQETITSVEQFIALQPDAPEEVIDVVEDIFETNVPVETDVGMELEPIEVEEITYESIEIEIAEIEIEEIQVASLDVSDSETLEVNVVDVEQEIEMELELEVDSEVDNQMSTEEPQETNQAEKTESSPDASETNEEENEGASTETNDKPNEEEIESESTLAEKQSEEKQEEQQESKDKNEQSKTAQKKQSSKEKAAKKVLKKIDDKQKYDSSSQLKTLVVMQVLGNTKTFFDTQQQLNDRVDFFTDTTLPDAVISDNDIAGYLLFAGSDGLMNEIIESQY